MVRRREAWGLDGLVFAAKFHDIAVNLWATHKNLLCIRIRFVEQLHTQPIVCTASGGASVCGKVRVERCMACCGRAGEIETNVLEIFICIFA